MYFLLGATGFRSLVFALGFASITIGVLGASTFSPARPPSIPLAVRSPYLSTWLPSGSSGGNGGYLAGEWPSFWAGQVTGWAGIIRVDGAPYVWMGAPLINVTPTPPLVSQTAFEYTSTRSTFIMNVAGKVSMNITFLSPVNPSDIKRQSLIFSYLSVSVQSIDGGSHSVQVYADISAEWVAGDHTQQASWSYGTNNGIASHKVWRSTQANFQETNQQADFGNWYWSTGAVNGMTYQSGQDAVVRTNFATQGSLPNTVDTNFRAINLNWPVFAFANNLGNVGSNPTSTVYTIGLCQQNAINFLSANGVVAVPSLWTSYFSSDLDAVQFFYQDWSNQLGQVDHRVAVDSLAAGGNDYLTITSLSARQALAGVQLCGTTSKPYVFLKEISSDGNTQTVDVIFPFHPILLYFNPAILKYTLDPLFEQQEAGEWPNLYSIHDLGEYPGALGHQNGVDEQQPLEECGNMIIMTLAYAQRANDVAYLRQHYNILKQWNQYLISESLIPANQISTDDFAGSLANQTNLALKGIIAIKAMSVIAGIIGNAGDSANFGQIAQNYINQWQSLGITYNGGLPHTTLSYGDVNSHGLLYNIYSDKLLCTNLVPQSVYDMQSAFYPTVADAYGVPLDTRHSYTKSDWQMFTAAVASSSTRSMFIGKLANWIRSTASSVPFTDWYDAISGNFVGFQARPVVGGHFALLALGSSGTCSPPPTTTVPPPPPPPPPPTTTAAQPGPTQSEWGQCGGIGYNGPTVCGPGITCRFGNPWYSQCLP